MEFVRNAWYFAAWSREIAERPLHRRIGGEDLALFRDSRGAVHAVGAACPHRGANLGKGRVVGDQIECPYHGWRFGADGVCARIPSQPSDHKIPRGARVPTRTLQEQQGVVWIWPGREEPFEEAPRFDLFEDESSLMTNDPDPIESEFVNVVENAFDDSHVHFLHRTTVAVETAVVPRQTVDTEPSGRGLVMRWDQTSPWGQELFRAMNEPESWFARQLVRRYGMTDYDRRYALFRLGGAVLFHLPTVTGHVQSVIGLATPMDPSRTWFATALRHPLVASRFPKTLVRWWGKTLNAEDQTGTVGLLRRASEMEVPISVEADRGGLAFRRMYAEALRREAGGGDGLASVPPRERSRRAFIGTC